MCLQMCEIRGDASTGHSVYVMSYASKIPGSRLYHYLCLFDAPKNRICTFQLLHYPSEMLAMLERR
jgi:hypothetical protein